MRPIVPFLALAAAAAVVAAGLASLARAEDKPTTTPAPAAAKDEIKTEVVYVELKGAEGAEVAAVAKALAAVEGVRAFAWTAEGTEAKVVREVGKAADDALVAAAKGAGAETAARVPTATGKFAFEKALHCGGCVKQVTKALTAIPGVKSIEVPDAKTHVSVVYDTRAVKPADIEAALAAIKKPARVAP